MILEMDFGNTRIKWRLREGARIIVRDAALREKGLVDIGRAIESYQNKIQAIWVASVLDESAKAWINFWARKNIGIAPVYAESQSVVAGVTNGYENFSILGVDRWLASVAAYNACRSACVVISAGTALTVDLITQEGRHLGGFIVPGWSTAILSLNSNTQLINLQEIKISGLLPGVTTQLAVSNGLAACYVGLIQNAITQLAAQTKSASHTILATGGDAWRLQTFFPQMQLCEDLVLDGLAYCLAN